MSTQPEIRRELIAGPTPLVPLSRLSAFLGGPPIYMKRDDLAGPGLGGNKARKLEYLLADALAQGADTLVTVGGLQSNHCRQTAAVAAAAGLDCALVLSETTLVQDGQFRRSGNLVLDRLFGAEIHVVAASDDRNAALDDLCQRMAEAGRRPYAIPVGGSNAIGAMGYRRAARELLSQCDAAGLRPAEVITCSGSGGTQAGLAFGFAEMDVQTPLLGISCWKAREELSASVASIVGDLQRLVDVRQLTMPEIAVDDSQIGVGYGVPTDAAIDAIKLCARLEGILLDPVYTGKAMAGLIRRIGSGFYDGKSPVIFVHTGGAPALFAYDQFVHDGLGEQPRQRASTPRGE